MKGWEWGKRTERKTSGRQPERSRALLRGFTSPLPLKPAPRPTPVDTARGCPCPMGPGQEERSGAAPKKNAPKASSFCPCQTNALELSLRTSPAHLWLGAGACLPAPQHMPALIGRPSPSVGHHQLGEGCTSRSPAGEIYGAA